MSKSDIAVSVRGLGSADVMTEKELISSKQFLKSGDGTRRTEVENDVTSVTRGAENTLHHIPELDGLRGVAVLMVLAHHLFVLDASTYSRPWKAFFQLMQTGWLGVDLFFVLSGFLITRILLQAKDRPNYFLNFYARRSLRIFPLYFGLLTVASICKVLDHNQIYLWTYTTNIKIAMDRSWVQFSRSNHAAFGYLWTLAIEEHFYLLWPLVVFICPRRLLIPTALGTSLLCLVGRTAYVFRTGQIMPAHVLTPFRVDTLLLGAAAGALVF